MRSYTNVSIPETHDPRRELMERLEEKDLKISQLEKRVSGLDNILNNIPRAVEEWGYVDISFDNDKSTVRLVKKEG